jgi:hypothetical protein
MIPRKMTSGLLKRRPATMGHVSRGRFAYLARSGILMRGGITLEIVVFKAFIKSQPRAGPEAFCAPRD